MKKTVKKTSQIKTKNCVIEFGKNKEIEIDCLVMDSETQSRQNVNQELIEEYCVAFGDGDEFPAIEVVSDGVTAWVCDGWHRVLACKRYKSKVISANIIKGTLTDAIWLASAANRQHGQRRSNQDKRRAVGLALKARPDTSSRDIAKHCGVSHEMVNQHKSHNDTVVDIQKAAAKGAGVAKEAAARTGEKPNPAVASMAAAEAAIYVVLQSINESAEKVSALVQTVHGVFVNGQSVTSDIKNARSAIEQARPYKICPMCEAAGCKTCRDVGWVSKRQWQLIPENMRAK